MSTAAMGFALASITSSAQLSVNSFADPTGSVQDTSSLDLSPDLLSTTGGNYIGTAASNSLSTNTTTVTNTGVCDPSGTCTPDSTPPTTQTTDWSNASDLRSLNITFYTPALNFGFDYIVRLLATSPTPMTHPFGLILSFTDGTSSGSWVGGDQDFTPDPIAGTGSVDGFMGITSTIPISSVALVVGDRYFDVATDSTTDRTCSDSLCSQYTDTTTNTTVIADASSLILTNLSVEVPEPGTAGSMAFAGLLMAAIYGGRRLMYACRKHRAHRAG